MNMSNFIEKTLFFIFSFLTLSLWAQDGINYQGAATDANGDELTNQNISIRASVLSASASGNLEWEETHSATTDQFGLFNVVIGQGTNTTNGATATFDDMDWGSANHFLKIEMDATGGTNYAMIGTTQMMSVPYALYAKSAGIDSTMLANMIGSSGGGMGGGCDWRFPDGLDGDPIIFTGYSNDYTVPAGKTLYITVPYVPSYADISIDGIYLGAGLNTNGQAVHNPIVANEGQIVGGGGNFYGFLFDNSIIEPITWQLPTSYTVPLGKELFILHQFGPGGANMNIDGVTIIAGANNGPNTFSLGTAIKLIAGQVVSALLTSSFNGYLVDENYFSGCGGGSSSGASNATIDSLSQVVSSLDSSLTTLISYFGCTDSTAINYDPAAIADDGSCTPPSLAIGDTYKGGIVFYLDGNGGGLIAAPTDIGGEKWGCHGTTIGVYCWDIGTGVQNTIDIYNSSCLDANAASACVNLTLPSYGGYNDWVLPSMGELTQMFLIQTQLGLANTWYWSSTEIDNTLAFVRNQTQYSSAPKNSGYNIRPIRAF